MRSRRLVALPLFIALAIGLLLLPAYASAAKLTETGTGLSVTAPRGYTLTQRNGVYIVRAKGRYAKFLLARTSLTPAQAGAAMAKGMKGKISKPKVVKGVWRADIIVGMRALRVVIRRERGSMLIALFGPGTKLKAAVGKAGTARVTAADIVILSQIIASRRGGRTVPLNVPLPQRVFRAPVNNGATAVVPNLPGWTINGTDTGYLFGSAANQGAFELGGFTFVNYPGFAQQGTPAAPFQASPAFALGNVFPQWKQIHSGFQMQFQQIVPVNGTAGLLGAGYNSEMYVARFTVNGQPWQGLFTVGTMDNEGSFLAWGMYYSYVAVPVNGPGGVFQALINTWSTWDNSAASQARLAAALQSVLTTRPVSGGPIDPEVFEAANLKWSEYLRG